MFDQAEMFTVTLKLLIPHYNYVTSTKSKEINLF